MTSFFRKFHEWNLHHGKWLLGLFFILLLVSLFVSPFFTAPELFKNFKVSVDAIPDLSENQQILLTEWAGRSPQIIEAQITYPLSQVVQGLKGVKKVRAYSYFGFSMIFVIFEDKIPFYESRTRLLEKISLSKNELPAGTSTSLGPDSTSLGQVFWYTLEGEGWSLQELRSIQDWLVKPFLSSTLGVSEIASIGGYVKEYQIELDPDKLKSSLVKLSAIEEAIRNSNLDIGAMSLDQNHVETAIRGLGLVSTLEDLENIPLYNEKGSLLRLKNVAQIHLGPALRRGLLNKNGIEAVGGSVVARYGENPLVVIENVKDKISQLQKNLPAKLNARGELSKVKLVPFYDRSILIHETLSTLKHALFEEILITLLVILVLLANFRASFLVGLILPLGVLFTFLLMKLFNISSSVMSLSGIAIAIGAMTDMGVITIENILKRLKENNDSEPKKEVILKASIEISPALLTSSLMILVSFFPIFLLNGAEGKLFTPLAWTKTFAIATSVLLALTLIPLGTLFFWKEMESSRLPPNVKKLFNYLAIFLLATLLAYQWRPLTYEINFFFNLLFTFVVVFGVLLFVQILLTSYEKTLKYFLTHQKIFYSIPILFLGFSLLFTLGFEKNLSWLKASPPFYQTISKTGPFRYLSKVFPGQQTEFMPALDEGAFLYMPSTVAHASISEVSEVLKILDTRLSSLPEIESVVGKAGRVESALDPAPLGMIEILINYKPKYQFDEKTKKFQRQWRAHIESERDLWNEIASLAEVPGLTGAPQLAPIANRILMLQTGVRSPFVIKVTGTDLKAIEQATTALATSARKAPGILSSTVVSEANLSVPTLDIIPNREKLYRYGISMKDFQTYLESGLGGMEVGKVLEGREKYAISLRFSREKRDQLEAIKNLLIPVGRQVYLPLSELAEISANISPMVIKSEDQFLTGYVLFDKLPNWGEIDAINAIDAFLKAELKKGTLSLAPNISFHFAGNYENQIRSRNQMLIIFPLALLLIWLILYFQFQSWQMTLFIFSEIAIALMGGLILLGLFSVPHFLNLYVGSKTLHEIFHVGPIHFSVAVWVGFLALFGIANNDGVLMGTYLQSTFKGLELKSVNQIHDLVVTAGKRRILPCLMTTAITLTALLPILTNGGRGSEIMLPMAVPIVGGVIASIFGIYLVPVLFAFWQEKKLRTKSIAFPKEVPM